MKLRNLLPFFCLACTPAWADAITVVLDSSQINGSPGQQVTFSGVIVNNELAPVDLNDISVTLNGLFTVDTTPFFSGPLTVAASTSSAHSQTSDFDFFNVVVDLPYTDAPGIKSGTLTILGGVEGASGYDPTTQEFLGSTTFSVDVVTPAGTVPEPSTLPLLMMGAALVMLSGGRSRWIRWRERIARRVPERRGNL